ncbi:MAG TPA: LamG domain-containing protein, partial [Chthonomonadaceae bacterium]|nr:LamG domain-containing protein [Chthonomonadaceae bacterium]
MQMNPTPTGSVPVPPPPGIIAWWSFDETSGNQAADRLGKSPGAYVNNPVPAPGLVKDSLRFNGSNYVSVPDSSLWNFGSKDFTIEFWVNFDTPQGGSTGHPSAIFVGVDEGPGSRNKWFFALGGGNLEFHINSPTLGAQFFPLVPFAPTVGQWYHLAIVRSGFTYTIFINGAAAGSATNKNVIPSPNAPLTIGQAELIGFLQGRMDELTLYSRALSKGEIQAVYNAGSAGKALPLAVYPNQGGDTGQVTVLIEGGAGLGGATFSSNVTVALQRTGQPAITANPVIVAPDGSSLYATFNLASQ